VAGCLARVILRLHSTVGTSVTYRPPNLLSLLKILGLIPYKIMLFACSTYPFMRGAPWQPS
jgi:hypothetical protein